MAILELAVTDKQPMLKCGYGERLVIYMHKTSINISIVQFHIRTIDLFDFALLSMTILA